MQARTAQAVNDLLQDDDEQDQAEANLTEEEIAIVIRLGFTGSVEETVRKVQEQKTKKDDTMDTASGVSSGSESDSDMHNKQVDADMLEHTTPSGPRRFSPILAPPAAANQEMRQRTNESGSQLSDSMQAFVRQATAAFELLPLVNHFICIRKA